MHLPRLRLIIVAVLALSAATFCPPPAAAQYAEEDVDVSVFYDELNEGGEWFQHPRWGYVWAPDVDEDWRPYTRGQWIYTDDHGWFWDSDEPWAWAVYHYGRWAFDEDDGWIWVPGTRWAPAWVAWRHSDDNIGWAPLPPDAAWRPGLGIVFGTDFYEEAVYDPYWVFVEPRFFANERVYRYARPRNRNRSIIRRTRPSTDYGYSNRHIVNRGINARTYRRLTQRNLPRKKVFIRGTPSGKGDRARSRSGSAELYRPGKKSGNRGNRLKAPRVLTERSKRPGTRRGRVTGPAAAGPGNQRPPFVNQQRTQKPNKGRQEQYKGTTTPSQQPAGSRNQEKRDKKADKGAKDRANKSPGARSTGGNDERDGRGRGRGNGKGQKDKDKDKDKDKKKDKNKNKKKDKKKDKKKNKGKDKN